MEKCDRCGVIGDDRRTLWMACLYEMRELGIPFELVSLRGSTVEHAVGKENVPPLGMLDKFSTTYVDPDSTRRVFYTMRVCKGCRSDWMRAIKEWYKSEPSTTSIYNNDSAPSPAMLSELVAALEKLRTDAIAIQQQINDTLGVVEQQQRSVLT